jgi:hypothetical protein
MERSLKAPLSPHEEGALRRIALGISKPKHLPGRDVDYLTRLGLVEEIEGRVKLTHLGRMRYQGMPNDAAMSDTKDEAAATLRRHILQARRR